MLGSAMPRFTREASANVAGSGSSWKLCASRAGWLGFPKNDQTWGISANANPSWEKDDNRLDLAVPFFLV